MITKFRRVVDIEIDHEDDLSPEAAAACVDIQVESDSEDVGINFVQITDESGALA